MTLRFVINEEAFAKVSTPDGDAAIVLNSSSYLLNQIITFSK